METWKYVQLSMLRQEYLLIDDGLDIYIWDDINKKNVAAVTSEQKYWIEIDGKKKYFTVPRKWYLNVKKYFGIG